MSKATYIFKVPVAGDGAVGKTSLIVRYTQGTFTDTYKMTIGTSFAVKTVDLGTVIVKLQIWDLAGQPHFGGVRPLFYQGSTGVIYVLSVIDRSSFEHLAGWLEETRKNAGNIPGILIGNKTDLLDQRVVSREEAEAFAAQAGLQYVETSAKMDENVGDAFILMAKTIIGSKWPGQVEEAPTPPPAEPAAPAPVPEPEPVAPTPNIEPIPKPVVEVTPEPEPEPAIEPEVVVPMEPPPVNAPDTTPIPPPSEPQPVHEDVVVEVKTESSLVEFIGIDPQALSLDDFEKRTIHAMQRLGVSEVGVLGTFLRSLTRQGQRDVVIESLESLQEER
ncbi:MAG: GTP-binding protein [Promethearchaeota archaeon]